MLDDPLMQADQYQRMLNKFYACLRFRLYHTIKEYAKNNEVPDGVIEDDIVLEMAKNIDITDIYTEVCKLYSIDFVYDVNLAVKKMEYVFTQKEPVDEDFVGLLECLSEAHN